MASSDINSWRRQNSDVVAVVITLQNGTILRGTILQPKDKTLRELFNMPEPFLDFEDAMNGDTVIAKSSIMSIRKHELPNANQLDKKMSAIEKSDPYRILGVSKGATQEEFHTAYLGLARTYHPDRFASINLPPEVADYIESMTRRINIAYSELTSTARAGETQSGKAKQRTSGAA